MKTTIDLPDPLLQRAKRLAAKESTTLRALVEAGLRHVLKEGAQRGQPFVLRDARVEGEGLNPEFTGASWSTLRSGDRSGPPYSYPHR